MSKKEKVEIIIEGGKASAGAQMGQAFGPLGVNIQAILQEINKKTAPFKGMRVPVKILVDPETKGFEITVGTPPVSELIKKELNLEKGSGTPDKEKIANIAVEQLIKIAKMKEDSILHNSLKSAVKTVAGSCNSLGVLTEGKPSKEFNIDLESGKFDKEIKSESIEVPKEKAEMLKKQLTTIQESIKKALEKAKAEEEAAKEATVKPAEVKTDAKAEGEAAPAKPGEEKKPTDAKTPAAAGAKPAPAAKDDKKQAKK
jgi:large subunit ribosomal protein L11